MSKRQPAPQPDPRLDRYRQAAGRFYDGDVLAGHLFTRVDVWWRSEGPWWRRREVDPAESIAWHVDFRPDVGVAHPSGYDDGVDADPEELGRGHFSYGGRQLSASPEN